MRILLSGSSGFVGRPLADFLLSQGHELVRLIRPPFEKKADSIVWDPERGSCIKEDFEGFDAVIHLAGEPLFSLGRWTKHKKEKILFSRTVGTWFLSNVLAQVSRPPKIVLSASAIGYYGNRGEEILTEESSCGHGFLATVCSEWEQATRTIKARGSRVICARFGTVLGSNGGALEKMLFLYKLGLGGRLGSGNQWMSWVQREDLIRSISLILQNESLDGPVNVVSPHPVRQEEFAKVLAKLLHRPTLGNVPAWLLRFACGQLADEMLLSSARVLPKKLLDSDFSFLYPRLKDALGVCL